MYTPDIGIFPHEIRERWLRYDDSADRLYWEEYASTIKEGEFYEQMPYPGFVSEDSGPCERVMHHMRVEEYKRWLILKELPQYQAGIDRQNLGKNFPSWGVTSSVERILTRFGSNYAPVGSWGFNINNGPE